MPDADDTPLIHTTRGNLPVASLQHAVEWRIASDLIQLTETYRDADGVVVRQDVHLHVLGAHAESTAIPQE